MPPKFPGDRPPKPPKSQKIESQEEMPMKWFFGTGTKARGLIAINFSAEFYKMGNQGISADIDLVREYLANPDIGKTVPDYKVQAETAGRRIKEITGFSCEELDAKLADVRKLYLGKQVAPFEIKLL